MIVLACALLLFVMLPCWMTWSNLKIFVPAPRPSELEVAKERGVSVIIPARNEAKALPAALDALLLSTHTSFEVIVVDDHSEDGTAEVVASYAERDARIRCVQSPKLPEHWNGKQHACWQGAQRAKHETLLFLDADVRLTPDAMTRCLAQLEKSQAPLISGFPWQETGTILERMLIPMMHVLLLGFLPIRRMRQTSEPGFAAGCGQLFVADRDEYFLLDGHRSIHASRHDGIQLPRRYRRRGYMTDIFDATDIAKCRMYQSARQVWNGLSKNAYEGIANPKLIWIFSLLLALGFILPVVGLVFAILRGDPIEIALFASLCILSFLPRYWCALRFRQSWLGVILHPLAVTLFLVIQWKSLFMHALGIRVTWRGRN